MGSNLGDRHGHLARALELLAAVEDVVAVSRVYETEPVGGPDQGPYLNLVAELATRTSARGLLGRCRALEQAAGRVRTVRFGPRTLDVDVLYVQDESVSEDDLVVPHPRMYERRFVLVPLSELAPELVPPRVLERASGAVTPVGRLDLSGVPTEGPHS